MKVKASTPDRPARRLLSRFINSTAQTFARERQGWYLTPMAGERMTQALARIDNALARLETQAALARHAPSAPAADPELARRHEALRASVEKSIGELDALIGGLEG